MQLSRAGIIFWGLLIIAGGQACTRSVSPEPNANKASVSNSNVAKTNAEELGLLINMPYEPADDDVAFFQSADGKHLTAVLLLKPEDADSFVTEAEAIAPPQAAEISSETWFPPELIAQSGISGDDKLKGVSYAPNTFLQPPFNAGRVTRVGDTNYFVLQLEAK